MWRVFKGTVFLQEDYFFTMQKRKIVNESVISVENGMETIMEGFWIHEKGTD